MRLTSRLKTCPRLESAARCWAGIFTGKDDILLFEEDDPRLSQIEPELLIPVMRAQGSQRYLPAVPSRLAIYPYEEADGKAHLMSEKQLKTRFPKGYAYLCSHRKELSARRDSRTTLGEKGQWYGLVRFGRPSVFGQKKIVSPGEVKRNSFALDVTGSAFSCARVFAITSEKRHLDLQFLLGLLNSSLVQFFLHRTAPLKAGGYYTYSSAVIGSVPLPRNLSAAEHGSDRDSIVKLVDQILAAKADDPTAETSAWEREIDEQVYKLYGLTAEEIKIVEGATDGTRRQK